MTIRPNVSLAGAELYFASRLYTDAWDNADNSTKSKALNQAAILVSGAFVFNDGAFVVSDESEVIWNERIIAGICEEALWLLGKDPNDIPSSLFNGISSASAGSVSATFDKSFVRPWICEQTKILIGDLGTFIADDSEARVESSFLSL